MHLWQKLDTLLQSCKDREMALNLFEASDDPVPVLCASELRHKLDMKPPTSSFCCGLPLEVMITVKSFASRHPPSLPDFFFFCLSIVLNAHTRIDNTSQKHSIVKEQRLGGIVRQQLVHYFCPHLQYTIAHTRIQAHTYTASPNRPSPDQGILTKNLA